MSRRLLGLFALVLVVSCQDSRLSDVPPLGPSFHISEARFGSGNADFFFAAPLAATPQPGDPNFDAGASNGKLIPYVRICETDGAPSALGCVTDVTNQVTGSPTGLAMSYEPGAELYTVSWLTDQLVVGKDYRIEIWGIAFSTPAEKAALDPRWLFGWRDIRNSTGPAPCAGPEPFCEVRFGQVLPVKSRIEQFVFCPVTKNCAVQFVTAGQDANLEAQLGPTAAAPSAQLFIPGQTGTNFAIAFEPCTASEDAAVIAAVDIPTFGPCLKTEASFTGLLGTPAIISLCGTLDTAPFGLPHNQLEQVELHHFSNDLTRVQALPAALHCATPTSGAAPARRQGLLDFARALHNRLLGWATPTPLFAAVLDRGGGGEALDIFSFFKLALPAKFEYVAVGDGSQTGVAGSSLVLRAEVTDLLGEGVPNARVRWRAITPPNEGATVLGIAPPGPTLTNGAGVAQVTVQLAPTSGLNVFHAFGRGIADDREAGCVVAPSTASSCNGPRTTFDPFMPFHVPEFDPAGAEVAVDLPDGTRLPFRVEACATGFGSATIDGAFGSGEWACAKSFPFTAKVAGGTTPATLYVMNNASTLFLAVRVQRSTLDAVSTLQFNFDNNNSATTGGTGIAEAADDVLSMDRVKGFSDAFLTLKCVTSSLWTCWGPDNREGGTTDGTGKVANSGGFTTYEIAHPLNTADDAHDFSLAAAAKVGLFLTLQTGTGASGNTQWPGFRQYLEIKIEP